MGITDAIDAWAKEIAMRGSDVKSVFESASGGVALHNWRIKDGALLVTLVDGRTVSWPDNGDAESTARALGEYVRNQMVTTAPPTIQSTASQPMPIDLKIKGLTDAVSRMREGIAAVRQASSDVHVSATAFIATAAALKSELDKATSDLQFEASQLGNGGPATSAT